MNKILSVALAFAGLITAAGPAIAQNAEAGKAHYATCVACHGDNAQGNQALSAPRLNHLDPIYIAAQLDKFRSGIRGGEGASATAMQMAPMAAILPDAQAVQDVAAYIAGLTSEQSAATLEGDVTVGGDYYNQFCGACHGGGALGNLSDRLFRGEGTLDGAVVDWIDWWFIPTFNIADAALNVGVALLLIAAIFLPEKHD